ncbi:hypothetical protein DFH09DRAFT_169455 [Mycena vulgaris]|nr:hypothetical protein DFH09DRAFT_169455 [Mycena vulgaris]
MCADLTALRLVEVTLPHGSARILPWPQLTEYSEIECTWTPWTPWIPNDLDERLESYRQLKNVPVSHFKPTGTCAPPASSVLFPGLRVASFSLSSHTARLIQGFDMPALEVLIIHYSDFAHLVVLSSSSRLKTLRVYMINFYSRGEAYAVHSMHSQTSQSSFWTARSSYQTASSPGPRRTATSRPSRPNSRSSGFRTGRTSTRSASWPHSKRCSRRASSLLRRGGHPRFAGSSFLGRSATKRRPRA